MPAGVPEREETAVSKTKMKIATSLGRFLFKWFYCTYKNRSCVGDDFELQRFLYFTQTSLFLSLNDKLKANYPPCFLQNSLVDR